MSSFHKLALLGAVTALLASGAAGCVVQDTDPYYGDPYDYPGGDTSPSTDIKTVNVDPGTTLDASPGTGVGLFVEYAAGGHWHVFTTCDTNISSLDCQFDIRVQSVGNDDSISNVEPEDLEPGDHISSRSQSVHLITDTVTQQNGFTFDTTDGASIQLEMTLDGDYQPRFIYWFGDSVLHQGAPSDPIVFAPAVAQPTSPNSP